MCEIFFCYTNFVSSSPDQVETAPQAPADSRGSSRPGTSVAALNMHIWDQFIIFVEDLTNVDDLLAEAVHDVHLEGPAWAAAHPAQWWEFTIFNDA